MPCVRTIVLAGLLVLGLGGSSASASTFDLGSLDAGDSKSGFVVNFATDAVGFDDHISFSLTSPVANLVGFISDITLLYGVPFDSLNFQLDLFNDLAPTTSLGTYIDPSGTGIAFSYLNLIAGDYYFRVQGDTGPLGNAYRYKIAVSGVPIPPALLLFGTALGGMAFAAYRRRKLNG